MNTPSENIQGLRKKCAELEAKNEELLTLTNKAGEAERAYRVALSKRLLELKGTGTQMAIIKEVALGDKIIADLKFDWHVAEAVQKACKESLSNLRMQVDAYRTLISWNKREYEQVQKGDFNT